MLGMLERGITLILFVDAILTMSRTFNLCSCTSMRDLRFQIRQVLSPSAAEASLFLSEMGWDAMYIAYGLHYVLDKKGFHSDLSSKEGCENVHQWTLRDQLHACYFVFGSVDGRQACE